jgi:tetratricopeptide (TPR) repeat protein
VTGVSTLDGADRLRRRRRLLLWSVVPVLLVGLLVAKILSVGVLGRNAVEGFERGDGPAVAAAASGLSVGNILEPHKALFAAGDALVLEQDYAGARSRFEEALAAAPMTDDCKIRVNLVLSIEALGDSGLDAGDKDQSVQLYREGLTVIKDAPPECFPGTPAPPVADFEAGEKLTDAAVRLTAKSEQASPQQPAEKDGGNEQPDPAEEARQSQIQQLEESRRTAQQERNDGRQRDEYLDRDGAGTDRPW